MTKSNPAVVLITGASSGIGRACAIHLALQGYHVFGTTRRVPGRVETDLRQFLASSDQLNVVTLDVDDNESVVQAIETIVEKTGRLDAVVNCAGFGIAGAVEETSDQEARAIFETNLLGILRVCRAAIPTMRTQGSGIVINISSIGGRIGLPFQG
ncbi:SDR family NAD(P)-dependent oxidoreductase, partial [Candidatus Bipolaricaulota bacterium]|nr:SDR family NAD(P)-dependent oxidoreductase [Candidatus Bipolaricaulota bacterium]